MLGGIGSAELLIIAGGIVLLFGSKKLPALGSALGESIKNFKKGLSDTPTAELPKVDESSDQVDKKE